jgi:hypothetical protein
MKVEHDKKKWLYKALLDPLSRMPSPSTVPRTGIPLHLHVKEYERDMRRDTYFRLAYILVRQVAMFKNAGTYVGFGMDFYQHIMYDPHSDNMFFYGPDDIFTTEFEKANHFSEYNLLTSLADTIFDNGHYHLGLFDVQSTTEYSMYPESSRFIPLEILSEMMPCVLSKNFVQQILLENPIPLPLDHLDVVFIDRGMLLSILRRVVKKFNELSSVFGERPLNLDDFVDKSQLCDLLKIYPESILSTI